MNVRTISAFLIVLAAALAAQMEKLNISRDGLAVQGYDVVAYFTDGKPVEGSPQFEYKWMGATWRFASAQHRDAFAKEPDRYSPKYGGYCAYGVSQGHTAPVDPEAWTVIDGKLYLNYSRGVRDTWRKDTAGYIRKAEENWPKLAK